MFKVNILTIFPDMFPGPLAQSLSGLALKKGIWSIKTINIRDFSTDKHGSVDDRPYGGGSGMVSRGGWRPRSASRGDSRPPPGLTRYARTSVSSAGSPPLSSAAHPAPARSGPMRGLGTAAR